MIPLQVVYDAFISKMLEDEWLNWADDEVERDWYELLCAAITWFKFPKVSLDITLGKYFVSDEITNDEVQILATYMKCEWLNRTILTWENVKPMYEERDFSPANFLEKLTNLLEREEYKAKRLEAVYYRTDNNKPFNYGRLAGN